MSQLSTRSRWQILRNNPVLFRSVLILLLVRVSLFTVFFWLLPTVRPLLLVEAFTLGSILMLRGAALILMRVWLFGGILLALVIALGGLLGGSAFALVTSFTYVAVPAIGYVLLTRHQISVYKRAMAALTSGEIYTP